MTKEFGNDLYSSSTWLTLQLHLRLLILLWRGLQDRVSGTESKEDSKRKLGPYKHWSLRTHRLARVLSLLAQSKPYNTAKFRAQRKLQRPTSGFHGSPPLHACWDETDGEECGKSGEVCLKMKRHQASMVAHPCHLSTWGLTAATLASHHLKFPSCEVQSGETYSQIPFRVTTLHFLSCDKDAKMSPEGKHHHEKNHSWSIKWVSWPFSFWLVGFLFCFVSFCFVLFVCWDSLCIPTGLEVTMYTRLLWNSGTQVPLPLKCWDWRWAAHIQLVNFVLRLVYKVTSFTMYPTHTAFEGISSPPAGTHYWS